MRLRQIPEGEQCANCRQFKRVTDFYVHPTRGRYPYCRVCKGDYDARWKRRRRGLPEDAILKPGVESPLGSTYVHRGYVLVKVGQDSSAHPRAGKHGWVYEHILVAESKYGIEVTSDYTVHHKNGNRQDNRPENLELRYGNHGKGADVIPALLLDAQCREDAIATLQGMGYTIVPPKPGDKRNK